MTLISVAVALGANPVAVDVSLNYPWLGKPLLQLINKAQSEAPTNVRQVAEQIVAHEGIFESNISAAVARVKEELYKAKDDTVPSNDKSSLSPGLERLKHLLAGREKLHQIALSSIKNPVTVASWITEPNNQAFANLVDAIAIAKDWDNRHHEYLPGIHDNATVVVIAAAMGWQLQQLVQHYDELVESAYSWSRVVPLMYELLSPSGSMFGDKVLRYTDYDAEMKHYVEEDLLNIRHQKIVYLIARDLLKLPANHLVVTTTTTSTTTRAPVTSTNAVEFPSVLDILFGSSTPETTTTTAEPLGEEWTLWVNEQRKIDPKELQFWYPTVGDEEYGVWVARDLIGPVG